jgi:catechol 2,3-dioxygenase-like lactoylglutathione lyase family enzyme
MPIQYLQIVSVPVSDQDRAKEFYVDRLGWDLLSDESYEAAEGRSRWLEVRPPGGQTAITLLDAGTPAGTGPTQGMILRANDLERTVGELAARGVPMAGDIAETARARFVTFQDPDGNSWLVQEQKS